MEYAVNHLTECQDQVLAYWELVRLEIDNLQCDHAAFKAQDLPLARIKKIMKLDDDIRSMMISAEAPILFAKAAELFIRELTLRAWIHTERNRRRTLQRNDIAMAVSDGDTDQFDFLIDIVPREEIRGLRRHTRTSPTTVGPAMTSPMNVKSEAGFLTSTNGRQSNSTTDLVTTASSNAVTFAFGTANPTATILTGSGGLPSCSVVQPTTIQFAAAPSSTTGSANGTDATLSNAVAPIQYVLQLPVGAGGSAAGQPFHIQLLPQHFQTSTADGISVATSSTNTIPVVQVMTQAAGGGALTLPTLVQDANGQRTQLLHIQMPDGTPKTTSQ